MEYASPFLSLKEKGKGFDDYKQAADASMIGTFIKSLMMSSRINSTTVLSFEFYMNKRLALY